MSQATGRTSDNCTRFRLRALRALRPNSTGCHGPCRAGPLPTSPSSETQDTLSEIPGGGMG